MSRKLKGPKALSQAPFHDNHLSRSLARRSNEAMALASKRADIVHREVGQEDALGIQF